MLADVRTLLFSAFGDRFSEHDWDHGLGGEHVIVRADGVLVAHAAVVPRRLQVADRNFNAGYLESVATRPGREGEGWGSSAVEAAMAGLRKRYGLGALSTGRHSFYERLGWERWQGPTFVQRGPDLVRTPDEDDGIMVLRFGPSADVDGSAALTCDAREGDAW